MADATNLPEVVNDDVMTEIIGNLIVRAYDDICNGKGKVDDNIKIMEHGISSYLKIAEAEEREKEKKRDRALKVAEIAVEAGVVVLTSVVTIGGSILVPILLFKLKDNANKDYYRTNMLWEEKGIIPNKGQTGKEIHRNYMNFLSQK